MIRSNTMITTNNKDIVTVYDLPISVLSKVCLRTNHRVLGNKLYCNKIMKQSVLFRIIANEK